MTLSSKCCPKSITFSDKILISATQLVTPRQGDSHRLDRSSNTSVDPKLVDTGVASLKSLVPSSRISATDAVDLDEPGVCFASSYKSPHGPRPSSWPEGVNIPLPPDRKLHDRHVRKLTSYLDKLEQDPEELYEAVEVKRDVEAMIMELGEDSMENPEWMLS
ncbi:unnamed protein product [Cladocopium goreaui]|uniref:Uncharacterized protein n=1 Tax=Cladocopium goreaui TaxID=2562237 RepID=A0A9P1GHK8_9DINO|nr:unnamed protein product [Cladocopium goreaui]